MATVELRRVMRTQSLVLDNLDKPPLRPKAKVPYVVTYNRCRVRSPAAASSPKRWPPTATRKCRAQSAGSGTRWFAAGFDTTVGSSGEMSVYNPTGTPAVMDVPVYTAGGFSAPEAFQGLLFTGARRDGCQSRHKRS